MGTNAIDYLTGIEPTKYATKNITDLASIVTVLLNIVIGIGISIAILSVCYSAIMYTLSKGDKTETEKAWHTFIWGVIAAGFSLASIGIKNGVLGAIGVKDDLIPNVIAPAGIPDGVGKPAPAAPPPVAPPAGPKVPPVTPAPPVEGI